jgi:hypothetical protein
MDNHHKCILESPNSLVLWVGVKSPDEMKDDVATCPPLPSPEGDKLASHFWLSFSFVVRFFQTPLLIEFGKIQHQIHNARKDVFRKMSEVLIFGLQPLFTARTAIDDDTSSALGNWG